MHLLLVPVIVLVTQVPLAPGGFGVREAAFVLLYGQIGVPAEAALSLGLGWSLVLTAFGLSGGVALMLGPDRARRSDGDGGGGAASRARLRARPTTDQGRAEAQDARDLVE